MAAKVKLTDAQLEGPLACKARPSQRVMDTDVSGFGVRVRTKATTLILIARYPGSTNPTRRALGEYPTQTLARAREQARQWRELIEKGIDPKDEEERIRLAELRKNADTFDVAAEDYIKRILPKQRRGHIVAR